MAEPPVSVAYRGVRYKRNPDAKQRAHRVYYSAPRDSGRDSLHRDIWRDTHPGEDIPEGWHIHHDDHDPFNNDPGNLVLRSPKGHAAEHPENTGAPLDHLATIRPLAAEWHGSPEGIAWHASHGRATWEDRKHVARKTCRVCGEQFDAWFDRAEYCSRRCINRAAEHRLRRQAVCAICGSEHETDRKARGQTCSRKCAAALRKQRAA